MTTANKNGGQKRILFYVHFNRYDGVEDYVIYQLKKMKPIFDKIIIISNSKVSAGDKKKFNGLCDKFIQRGNVGYDFAAWRDGMNAFGWDKLVKYDELTIMNDTCFGPIYDFKPLYDKMQAKGVDFWGISNGIAMKGIFPNKDGKFIPTPEHIHSYYYTFNKNVFSSEVFKKFWTETVKDYTDVFRVIENEEIQLTRILHDGGFSYDSYYDTVKHYKKQLVGVEDTSFGIENDRYDPSYTVSRPLALISKYSKGYPFIKTKALINAAHQTEEIKEYLAKNTKYPVKLIDSYISHQYPHIIKSIGVVVKDEKNRATDLLNYIEGFRAFQSVYNVARKFKFLKPTYKLMLKTYKKVKRSN